MNKSMNKKHYLFIIGGLFIGLILPIAGMTMTPTRDLILGFAPDDAIVKLADKIDEQRVSTEATDTKVSELQLIIDSQKAEIVSYQKQIEEQNSKIENVNNTVKNTSEIVIKQKDCSADVNKYCYTSSFREPEEFKNFLKAYEKMNDYSKYKKKFTEEFNNCQKALKCN